MHGRRRRGDLKGKGGMLHASGGASLGGEFFRVDVAEIIGRAYG